MEKIRRFCMRERGKEEEERIFLFFCKCWKDSFVKKRSNICERNYVKQLENELEERDN